MNNEKNCLYMDSETLNSANFYTYQTQVGIDAERPPMGISGDAKMVKKLFHNANERDRRQKLNVLYSSLRSLLPRADQMKKSSIPATVSRMVKYIPELQEQVMELVQKKQELSSSNSRQEVETHQQKQPNSSGRSSVSTVSASRFADREVVIQISAYKFHKNPFSEILHNLEEDGLLLLNASSFECPEGGVFYNLHLEVKKEERLECEALSEKLMSLLRQKGNSFMKNLDAR